MGCKSIQLVAGKQAGQYYGNRNDIRKIQRGNTLYKIIIIIAMQHYFRENETYVTLMDDREFEGMRKMLEKKK